MSCDGSTDSIFLLDFCQVLRYSCIEREEELQAQWFWGKLNNIKNTVSSSLRSHGPFGGLIESKLIIPSGPWYFSLLKVNIAHGSSFLNVLKVTYLEYKGEKPL